MLRRVSALARTPCYLVLLPVFFVLHGYVQQHGLLAGHRALGLLAGYLPLAAIFWLAGRLLTGSWQKGALFAFGLLMIEFFFGSAQDLLQTHAGAGAQNYALLLPLMLLCIAGALVALRRRKVLAALPSFLNLLLLLFLLLDGGLLLRQQLLRRSERMGRHWQLLPVPPVARPDVYLIVADEYAGKKELAEQLHFDNRPFLDSLRRLGFQLPERARSNYNFTEYSTASLLNGNYLAAASRTNATDVGRCFSWIRENEAMRFFETLGYDIQNRSIFETEAAATPAPRNWSSQWNDVLRQQTLSARLLHDLGPTFIRMGWMQQPKPPASFGDVNEGLLRETYNLLSRPSTKPRFVYTHLLLPHAPYYRDQYGNQQPPARAENLRDSAAYIGYLQYGNGVYLGLLNAILRAAKRPCVILFLGDHGYRSFSRPVAKEYYFMNLCAIYRSPGIGRPWPDSVSNVNQFRVLLNQCFGQRLPLLPDRQYFIGDEK